MEQEKAKLKGIEEALKQSGQNYKALVNSLDGIVWEADARSFQFSFISKQAGRLLGYPVSRWLTEPTFWQDHIHPDDRDGAVAFCRKAAEKMKAHEFEYRMLTAGGRSVWLRDIVTVITENGQPTKLRGVMVDITEQKETEKELKKHREQLEELVEERTRNIEVLAEFPKNNPNPVLKCNKKGDIIFVNPAMVHFLEKLDLDGCKNIRECFPDLYKKIIQIIGTDKIIINQELELNGKVLLLSSNSFPDEESAFILLHDITRRKELEQELRKHREHLEELVDKRTVELMSTNRALRQEVSDRKKAEEKVTKLSEVVKLSLDMIFITDPQGKIEYVNPAFEKITGYSQEEAVGQTPRILKSGKMSAEFYKNVWDTIQAGKNMRAEVINRKKNGDLFVFEQAITPLKDAAGNIINFVSTGKDVTELVKTRQKLEQALEKAEQSNRVKTLFLANVSHEIRTPLNAILGFSDLIEASTHDLIGEEEQGFFKTIRNSGNRLMRTVHEILDISQIEAGTYNSNIEDLELNNLVRDIVHECQPLADEKSLRLEYTTDLDAVIVQADKHGVSQAITNLIDNAIKYTEQGKITVLLYQVSDKYVLSVEDTGKGFSEEYSDNLYEVFSQESEGYTKKFQGIGLGLAITKRYLDLNDVDIDFESAKGVGTIFTLTFKPVKKHIPEKPVEKERIRATPTPEPGRKPLVLVVEDDLSSQKLTEFFLKGTHDVCFAVSVAEAKQRLKKFTVELVLLDLSLVGDENGLDLVRWMRKTKAWRNTPVIATTAHAFTTDRVNCLDSGCNDYLAKPIKREKLLEKISAVV